MTEPEAGSDVGSLTTSAERSTAASSSTARRSSCSNAHIADHILVVCRTTKGESSTRASR
jgi:alkylation response protein AidB-like acyl-CoA dehydrogenase